MICKTGKHIVGPGFDASRVDGLTAGLSRMFRRSFHRSPSVLWHLRKAKADYARALEQQQLDAILSPALAHTTPPIGHFDPAQPFDQLFDRLRRYVSFTPLANVTGAPAIVLPMGITGDNLPVGAHFSARHGAERQLLELAFELEEAAPWPRINGAGQR
jgi:amidase